MFIKRTTPRKNQLNTVFILTVLKRIDDYILAFFMTETANHHNFENVIFTCCGAYCVKFIATGLDKLIMNTVGYDVHLGFIAVLAQLISDEV